MAEKVTRIKINEPQVNEIRGLILNYSMGIRADDISQCSLFVYR